MVLRAGDSVYEEVSTSRLERAVRIDTLQYRVGSEMSQVYWDILTKADSRCFLILPVSVPGTECSFVDLGNGIGNIFSSVFALIGREFRQIHLTDGLTLAIADGNINPLPVNIRATRVAESVHGDRIQVRGPAVLLKTALL